MLANTLGELNSAFGAWSLKNNIDGARNTAVGTGSLYYNTSGQGNTALGYYAGAGTSGANFNYCTFLGASTYIAVSRTNVTTLGSLIQDAQISGSNQIALGSTAISSIRAQVSGITAYSDARYKVNVKEDIGGLNFITKLRPVSYNVKPSELHKIWGTPDSIINKIDHSEIEQIRYAGFIAQEVEKAAMQSGFSFTGIDIPKNDKETYALRYVDFIMPLVKAVQEQQKQIEELKALLNKN